MEEENLIEKTKPEEVIRAEQLIDDGNLDEALTLLNNYEQKEGLSHYDILSCYLFQCQILFWQGNYKELIERTEQAFKESDGLNNSFFKVDSLLLKVHALVWLSRFDESSELITQGEGLMKTIPQELTKAYKQREAYLDFIKGYFYGRRRIRKDADLALEYLEHSLLLREELGIKHEIAETLIGMAWNNCVLNGELNRALKYAERGLALAKESSLKYYIADSLDVIALVYGSQGELDRSTRFYKQSIELFKELNNKTRMAGALNNLSYNYKLRGELDRALECIEQSMALHRELGIIKLVANNHDHLIQILIDKGDIERAQISLHDMEQLNSQLKDKELNLMYLFDKALVLKTSLRAIKRGKAEEILKQLLEDEDLSYDVRFSALLNLCELLLTELRITNDLEVLDELNQIIARLLDIIEKTPSYLILCDTLLIQAKLSLITFDIKIAQRFLTQAQQIAERFDLNLLAKKIAAESEDLLKKLDLWEKLKEEDAPMVDRMELARLDEKIVRMIQKHPVLTVQMSEEKIAISKEKKICLVCRGEVFGFSYICKCGANYCESCARAVSNLENVCWACEEAIDYSKPVKPYKKEEESVEMGEKSKKK